MPRYQVFHVITTGDSKVLTERVYAFGKGPPSSIAAQLSMYMLIVHKRNESLLMIAGGYITAANAKLAEKKAERGEYDEVGAFKVWGASEAPVVT